MAKKDHDAQIEPQAAEPSREDRVKALIDGYTHGMASNAPRTTAELAEIKSLLGVE